MYIYIAQKIKIKMIATSKVEKYFQKNNAYRRSKRYYDVEKIKLKEHSEEVQRRKPSASIETLDTRVDTSFVSSTKPMRQKLKKQLYDVWKNYQEESQVQEERPQHLQEKEKVVRVPNMSKMLSREEIYRFKSAYNHQHQFNNFYFSAPENKNPKLEQILPRKPLNPDIIQTVLEESIDTNQVGRVSQRIKFNQSMNKCLVDLQRSNQEIRNSREEEGNQVIMSTDRIKHSQLLTRKNESCVQYPFYLSTSKEVPCQMDLRLKKENEFFYQSRKEEENRLQISARQRKQRMIEKRALQLLKKKRLPDNRKQMCDLRYFRRNFLDLNY